MEQSDMATAGEARVKNPSYDGSEVDAQGARPLPMLNLTYVTNALWAGTFGSFGVNVGTESVWNQDTLVAINNKGLAGLEANDHRALIVHRQQIDKQILDELGYTSLFYSAFPDVPVAERYTRQTVRMPSPHTNVPSSPIRPLPTLAQR